MLTRLSVRCILMGCLLVAVWLPQWPAFAAPPDTCRCIWQGSFDKIIPQADMIVSGKIISRKGNSMDLTIDRTLVDRASNGQEFNDDIRIWGYDGKQCRPDVKEFPLGSEWLFALKKITSDSPDRFNPNTPNISFGRMNDYYLSMCGANWLQVYGNFATGNLLNGQRWQWSNDEMNPVLIDLIEAYINGDVPLWALTEAAKPQAAIKKLMEETKSFLNRQ